MQMLYYEAYTEGNYVTGCTLVEDDATDSEIWRAIACNVVDDYTILKREPVPDGGEETRR